MTTFQRTELIENLNDKLDHLSHYQCRNLVEGVSSATLVELIKEIQTAIQNNRKDAAA